MTAEPDLPINDAVPAPTKIEPGNLFLWNWRQMQVYAQACVAHATAAKDAEIEALREEVREAREFRDKMANAIGNDQLRRFIEKHGEPVPLTIRMQQAEARAERLAEEVEALRAEVERLTFELGCLRQHYDERTACMIVHRGAALACSAAVRAAYSEEHERAERLAEALRQIANQGPHYGPDGTYKTWRHWAEIARAALEQEAARG